MIEAPSSSSGLAGWIHANLPRLNAETLSGNRPASSLIDEYNAVLSNLDSPVRCSIDECRRRLTILGMLGSSAERHLQEAGSPPGQAISLLSAGGWPFRRYVATLASRAGGPPRDSLLSYAIWNAPSVFVYLPDARTPFLTLPSAFPDEDSGPFTFSDDPGERAFILLVKRCAALEEAANEHLWPVCDGSLGLASHQALRHVDSAIQFLKAVRAEMQLFLQRPEFTASFFLDVLRQYACPWDEEEPYVAPSGAHDYAFIVRDKLLGTAHESYDEQIDQLFNVLDGIGQSEVSRACSTIPLAELLRRELQLDGDFSHLSESQAADLAFNHPWLATYFRLYQASGDLAATHWHMIYKYMVGPMRERDYDAPVVSNHAGTTHMVFDTLRTYLSTRTTHPLSVFKEVLKSPRSLDASVKVDVAGSEGIG
jgi:hypothetical protein